MIGFRSLIFAIPFSSLVACFSSRHARLCFARFSLSLVHISSHVTMLRQAATFSSFQRCRCSRSFGGAACSLEQTWDSAGVLGPDADRSTRLTLSNWTGLGPGRGRYPVHPSVRTGRTLRTLEGNESLCLLFSSEQQADAHTAPHQQKRSAGEGSWSMAQRRNEDLNLLDSKREKRITLLSVASFFLGCSDMLGCSE